MLEWISANKDVLIVVVNLGTLLVWIFYAQLLLNNYRRQRRPRLLINQGNGQGLDSICIISNMSEEAIFVQGIVAVVETSKGNFEQAITDMGRQRAGDSRRPPSLAELSRQGPLHSGGYMELGGFKDIMERLERTGSSLATARHEHDDLTLHALQIHVIFIYGPENNPIGAERRFLLREMKTGNPARPTLIDIARPDTVDTRHFRSRRYRRRMQQWLHEFL